jgi:hypothetical protein
MSLIVDALRQAQKEEPASDSTLYERLFLLSRVPPLLSRRRRWVVSLVSIGVGFIGGVALALFLLGGGEVRDLLIHTTSPLGAREVSSFLLGIFILVALEGVILCLLLLRSNKHWMRHQQRFLREFFRTMHDLEERNQRVQWDLLLTLRSRLDPRRAHAHGQAARADEENSAGARRENSQVGGGDHELSPDEIQLLVALSTRGSKSLAEIHTGENSDNLEPRLRSLRDKGLIFYSDYSDRVAVLPRARSYIKEVPPGSFVIITPET